MRLLLLEDDERVARGVVRIAEALGHFAVHARSVPEAKGALQSQAFDIVISDLGLEGGESGLDLLNWARFEYPEIRRVLTSGAIFPADYTVDPPRQEFLHKPFGRAELTALLRRVERPPSER
jgi:DNA-binding response OmpR family regulator